MSTTEQLTLALDVAEPAWLRAIDVRPGDRIQTRDHSGGKLWTPTVTSVRATWRATRSAWPVPGLLLRYERRVTIEDDRGDTLRHRLSPDATIEVIDRAPDTPGPRPHRRPRRLRVHPDRRAR